jgi:putative methionine-R-sulfoxide reductase with GAF domain
VKNIELLEQFINTRGWSMIRNVLLERIGVTSYWVTTPEGEIIFIEEQDHLYCRAIKATPAGATECRDVFEESIRQAAIQKTPTVFPCHAGFLGFYCPIMTDKKVVGVLGGCEIIDAKVELEHYVKVAEKFGLDTTTFIASIQRGQKISVGPLEQDIELIALVCQLGIEAKAKHREVMAKDVEVHSLAEFYRLFEESRNFILTLEPKKLYKLIVNLTAKAMKAEICSLMLIDEFTQELAIKAAIGIDEEVIKKTRLPIGKGVVGYVAKTGEPLLVKDVTADSRFNIKKNAPKYYTKSLISAPLKIGDKVLGVININNKATREPFTESDIKLLSIICGHAAIAIENSRAKFSEEKEKVSEEIEEHEKELKKTVEEKEELIQEKEELEVKVRETEETIRLKEELIRTKEALLK